MFYQVSELAEAIGAVERTLRDWLVLGAPHLRDEEHGRVWISWTRIRRLGGGDAQTKTKPEIEGQRGVMYEV